MARRLCYIAAPFRAADPTAQVLNIARASLLARLAITEGLAPVLTHPAVPLVFPEGETVAARAVGLDWSLELVRTVARSAAGVLYVLEAEDGPTPGMVQELLAWRQVRRDVKPTRRGPWPAWRQPIEAAGLGHQLAAVETIAAAQEAIHGPR